MKKMPPTRIVATRALVGVPKRQSGMTLVELMIGLLIGLVISGAATAVFLAANRMGRDHDNGGKLLEDGTFAINRMLAAVKRSGYVDLLGSNDVVGQLLDNGTPLGRVLYDPTSVNTDKIGALYSSVLGQTTGLHGCINSIFNTLGDCTTQGADDALLVAYQATNSALAPDPFSPSLPAAADGSAFSDCNGRAPPAGSDLVVNRYYVSNQQLLCAGSGGGAAQVLASNVEQFRVSYGVSNWALPSERVRRVAWQTADQVGAVNRWNAVIQVELCLMMVGPPGSAPNPAVINYCDGTTATTADSRMIKTFRSIVALRNAPLSS